MPNLKIKAETMLAGTTIRAIARDIGVSRVWVSMVINGHSRSDRVRVDIAKAVGKKVTDLWPNNGSKTT